jgi:uncharacterized protein (TIGR04551 family)
LLGQLDDAWFTSREFFTGERLPMPRIVMTVLLALIALPARAQDGGVAPISPLTPTAATDNEAIRRDLDAARREVKEMREEMRAQLATQSVSQGWQEDWVDEKKKLELLTFDGYLRVRPELFHKFDLGRPADAAGYTLWPTSPLSGAERTNAGVNMRFRFEPTINISEEVRIRAQIDALDNLVWGSTPDYAFSRNAANGYWYDRNEFSVLSNSQAAPQAGINSLTGSVNVKRLWGEVATPIGVLKFGRMGSHWGLGLMHNDGNGIDSDWGDTVDRVMFVAEPLSGFYVTPMADFNVEGLLSPRQPSGGQQFDLSNSDDSHSFILAVARRDTDTERLAKLDANQVVFNYGLHFEYRVQRNDSVDYLSQPLPTTDGLASSVPGTAGYVQRDAKLFMPDLWAKVEKKSWRIEAEFASQLGYITNRALTGGDYGNSAKNQRLDIWQFGAVIQGEYKLLNGDLEIGAEVGFASGDKAPGFGNYPRRTQKLNPDGTAVPGVIDGPQYNCSASGCLDNTLRAFRFNKDYRVDMILYREILGGITDSLYIKPRASYRITTGFTAFAALIYSRAIYAESTPSASTSLLDPNLGIEINAGAKYETEDGFFAQVQYGVLFPLGGFAARDPVNPSQNKALDIAQAVRGVIGIKF